MRIGTNRNLEHLEVFIEVKFEVSSPNFLKILDTWPQPPAAFPMKNWIQDYDRAHPRDFPS